MNESSRTDDSSRRLLAWVLGVLFVTALLMGPGPGVMLVNRPESILGFPSVYMWGLLWYAVEVVVVLAAYFFVWRDDEDEQPPDSIRESK